MNLLKLTIWSGGLFIIDILLIGGAVTFLYFALKASKSGSVTGRTVDNPLQESDINVPWYKTGQGVFAIILFLAEIVSVFIRKGEI